MFSRYYLSKGMQKMIVFDNVKKLLDGKTVLDLKELTIPKGALYGLIGANGAGKSTMLRLISGVYTADEGIVSVDGENILDNAKMKEKLFFVPDDPYFLTWLLFIRHITEILIMSCTDSYAQALICRSGIKLFPIQKE